MAHEMLLSVELHRLPKPRKLKKSKKSKIQKKSGFEPRTFGLAVGSLNHCTGSDAVARSHKNSAALQV
jgi:hypothetical protein